MATPNGNGSNGHVGKVVQIIGPVVVEFSGLRRQFIRRCGSPQTVSRFRTRQCNLAKFNASRRDACRSLDAADRRHGARHERDGHRRTITVPVGEGTLGRVMNVIGDPVITRPIRINSAINPSSRARIR
jgi:F-type H+-transporting ATPase subunit beta